MPHRPGRRVDRGGLPDRGEEASRGPRVDVLRSAWAASTSRSCRRWSRLRACPAVGAATDPGGAGPGAGRSAAFPYKVIAFFPKTLKQRVFYFA
uniref:Uncharacterized protein n=1 Tax=Sphaerodactylus townsendi TaxID=933632 RepID=A0ACB8FCW4_9SAUR